MDRVRVVVVGDSGVGKSSLVHLLVHETPLVNAAWTIGAAVDVKIHEFKQGTPAERTFYVELWDVGGNKSHANTRSVFYNAGIHGAILCHDLSNKKSAQNLSKWVEELAVAEEQQHRSTLYSTAKTAVQLPFIIVGTKVDLFMAKSEDSALPRRRVRGCDSLQEELQAEEIFVDTTSLSAFSPGSGNAVKISRFFDRAVERRLRMDGASFPPVYSESHFYSRNSRAASSGASSSPPFSERRRIFNVSPNPLQGKVAHVD